MQIEKQKGHKESLADFDLSEISVCNDAGGFLPIGATCVQDSKCGGVLNEKI